MGDHIGRRFFMERGVIVKGFSHRCPHCGEPNGLRLHLDDISLLTCQHCDSEISTSDIKSIIAEWERLLAWVATAPTRKDA